MRYASHICPRFQLAVDLLGKRWTGLILNALLRGPTRFGALAASLEVVSERMLSERLKELEAEGIVARRVLTAAPIGVEYELTPKGRALREVFDAIGRWAERWVEAAVPDTVHGKRRRATAR
ncbi:MAG: winged helix-turn-helix transcriptional regulator [Deltaproteobacteria bacterium]